MKKKELIEEIMMKTNMTKRDVEIVVDTLVDTISETLAAGEKVTISSFATFDVRELPARKTRNPRTGEQIDSPAKKFPVIKPGKLLKQKVDQ